MTSEYLYRLHAWPTCSVDEWDNVHSGPIEGYMRKYPIIKRTPKGCWISMDEIENPKKFVLLTARKRYACPTEGEAVESFIARKSDPDGFVEGSWVLGVKVLPDEIWKAIKSGELNGFSFYGSVQKVSARATVVTAKKITGFTEPSTTEGMLPPHSHALSLELNEDGRVVLGKTVQSLGHTHEVLRFTATERAMEHSHRMILINE